MIKTKDVCCNNSDIRIRQARLDDVEGILAVYSQPSIDNGEVLPANDAGRILQIMEAYPFYKLFIAQHDKRVVGTIAVLIMDNIGHLGRKSAIFESIAVLPEWQGKGVGTAMLAFAADLCKQHNCYKITLSADIKRTKAHAFYESQGFAQHGFSYQQIVR